MHLGLDEGSRAGVQAAAEGTEVPEGSGASGAVLSSAGQNPRVHSGAHEGSAPAGGDEACRLIPTGATAARGRPGRVGRSKLLRPPSAWASPVPPGAGPTRKTLGSAAVWFAGSQAQRQEAECGRASLELRP